MATKEKASERIDLKASPSVKSLIDQGAAAKHKSRSEFILEASVQAAQEAIMDRTTFPLDDADWTRFHKVLSEQDPQDTGWIRLLETHYSWD